MAAKVAARGSTTKVNPSSKPPVGKKAPTKVPPVKKAAAKKVVGTMAPTKSAKGKQGKVPAVGFGKQRVNANRKMLLLAKAKLVQRQRAAAK